MRQQITSFIDDLADTRLDGPLFNPYTAAVDDQRLVAANRIRRQNLQRYLVHLANTKPRVLLVGEAPGYRGCRLTGVPFTSEAIILDARIWPFGGQAGYRKTAEQAAVVKEATATIVWSALKDRRRLPLLWNALPFHPYRIGLPASNRRPNRQELLLGRRFLVELIAIFMPQVVVAVGRSAARALDLAGLSEYKQLRHPSHGGKKEFLTGLAQLSDLTMEHRRQLDGSDPGR
ncbi:MAG: uracil-DNA glycosylase family protein [Chloroflexota bacterium]|jgi:uracil-DNA glycosylase